MQKAPSKPSRAASLVLRSFCLIVDVDAPTPLQQSICRFLLSLAVSDAFGWVVYKIIQFESVL